MAWAFAGVEVVIDTLNARSGPALQALPATSGAVLNAAAQAARARGYGKAELITTVVAATQFHNLVAGIFVGDAKIAVIPAFMGVSVQPMSTADVTAVLVSEALRGGQENEYVLASGPAVQSMHELALLWKLATGSKALLSAMSLPGSFGVFLGRKNLLPAHAVGEESFEAWLTKSAKA